MKNLFTIIILCSILVIPTFANTEWIELSNNGNTFYVDKGSILKDNSMYYYWVKNKTAKGITKMLMVSECSNNTIAMQKILTYNNSGKLLSSKDENQNFSIVVPDSNAQIAHDYICQEHYKQVKAENEKKVQQEKEAEKNKNFQNLINTGLGVGLYFLGK